MNRRKVELVAAILVGILAILGFVEAYGYKGQSSYMPLAATGAGVLLSLAWAIQTGRMLAAGLVETYGATGRDYVHFAVVCVVAILYVLGVTFLGFFTSTIVMVPLLAFALGYRHVPTAILSTAVFSLILYGVFDKLLSIPLPPEAILGAFGG